MSRAVPAVSIAAIDEEDATCQYMPENVQASRPGKPCIPPAAIYPYATKTQWRIDLGERIRQAAVGRVTQEQCGSWMLYGDQSWCVDVMTARQKGNTDILAYSYGIEERDEWSEKMGSVFKVPSHLYDCFIPPDRSPPIAKTAPNGTGFCKQGEAHCYEMPYWSYRVCLGHTSGTIFDRRYETLASHLKNRGPLSTHLKIDVEGSEWTVLEDLLNSEEDLAKVRSLDMEVHFGFKSASEKEINRLSERERLERQVSIFERLASKLAVTGTTMEVYRQGWMPDKDCPDQKCPEPVVHLRGGWSPQMFAISFVNRALLGGQTEDAAPAPRPAAVIPSNPLPLGGEVLPARQNPEVQTVEPACDYVLRDVVASRPGVPCIPPAEVYPYLTKTEWRMELGERIRQAAAGRVTEEQCGGWTLLGDASFCMKVFTARQQGNTDILAFSYGIEERDPWSEFMASRFKVPCHLYDCFIETEKSPEMAKTALNNTVCQKDQAHCYGMPYWSYRTCLGPPGVIDGRRYETLASHLKGRGPLSTHLKIDVEGSEWTILDELMKSPEDLAKVRSLDMEVHFGYNSASEKEFKDLPERERLERQVRIFEELSKKLIVTGTTIETYRQGWWPKQDCPQQQCHEPVVHLRGGWSPQMFAISYINRALL